MLSYKRVKYFSKDDSTYSGHSGEVEIARVSRDCVLYCFAADGSFTEIRVD